VLTQKRNGRGTVYYVDENDAIISKVCTKCDEPKTLDNFSVRKAGLGGRDSTCKACGVKRSIAHYEANKDEVLNKARSQREENHRLKERSIPKWRGLVGKMNQKGVIYYESSLGDINAKMCTTCGEIKGIDGFALLKIGLGGRVSNCKECRVKDYDLNREHEIARVLKHQRDNPDKNILRQHRRRARKLYLKNDFTNEQMSKTYNYFGGCALTGSSEIDWDHVIPLATGFGGTTYGNMLPLRCDLNKSKSDANIFEWFERNKERFNLSQSKFDRLIEWLAEVNGMTTDEYSNFVNGCFENKRNTDAGELGSHTA
jgi:hypothetical protein